jgi:hypothetical protein
MVRGAIPMHRRRDCIDMQLADLVRLQCQSPFQFVLLALCIQPSPRSFKLEPIALRGENIFPFLC